MATLYFSDGREKKVFPKNGTDFKLEELQKFVGGHIEIVYLNGGKIMVVNEEGKLNDMPQNLCATAIVMKNGIADTIVGDALVCDSKQVL